MPPNPKVEGFNYFQKNFFDLQQDLMNSIHCPSFPEHFTTGFVPDSEAITVNTTSSCPQAFSQVLGEADAYINRSFEAIFAELSGNPARVDWRR